MGMMNYSSGGPFSRAYNLPVLLIFLITVIVVSIFYWCGVWDGRRVNHPKVSFNPGDAVVVPCGNGVLLENYIGHYMLVRIDNGAGVVPRYSEVRFFKSEVSKRMDVEGGSNGR
jgi:hypothetical protein